MADSVERLLVRIDATTEQLRRELKAAEAAVNGAQSSMEKAQSRMSAGWSKANAAVEAHRGLIMGLGAAAVGGVALAVKSIASYSDSYQRLQGQLKLVTGSQDELNRVYSATKSLAAETGASLDATVNLYARMTRATEELNLTEQDRLRITETINKAMVVSGASTQEAEAAIRQLSQGMASGVLRGEELNSVMENSPRLARALADGLGVGIGQLREMGKAGELTSEAVVGALMKMGTEIDTEFTKMPVTVDRAMNRISIAMQDAIGKADMGPLTESINQFEEALNDPAVINGITEIASGIVSLTTAAAKSAQGIGALIWAVKELSGFGTDNLIDIVDQIDRLNAQLKYLEDGGAGTSHRANKIREELSTLTKQYDEMVASINKASAAREGEAKASEKQGKAQGQLSEIVVTATRRQSTAVSSYAKAQDSARKSAERAAKAEADRVEKIAETIKGLDRQLAAVNMNERAQVIYNATLDAAEYAHGEELASIVDKTVALYDQEQAIQATAEATDSAAEAAKQAAEESARAAEEAMQPWNDALQDMAANIDKGFSQAWTDAFSGAEDGFKNFADNIKNAFFNLLGNMAHLAITRPIVMQISAAMGGLVPAGATAGTGIPGSAGGIGNLFGGFSTGVSQLYGGAASGLRGIGFDSAANFADAQAGIYGQGGWTAAGYGALNLGAGVLGGWAGNKAFGDTSGVGSMLGGAAGSIWGPLGTAAGSFIGAGLEKALDNVFGQKNDGNNRGYANFNLASGAVQSGGYGKSFSPENVTAAEAAVQRLQAFADAIGGSTLSGNITVGGRDGIKYGGVAYGTDETAFLEAAYRDVINGATNLNDALKELVRAFDGTAEETAAYMTALVSMSEAVKSNPVEQAMSDVITSIDNASGGMLAAYRKQVEALYVLISEYDGTAGAAIELNDALVTSKAAAYELAVAILEMSGAIGEMLGDQAKYFREAVMSEDELRAAREKQRSEILSELRTASDPQEVMALVSEFATVNKQLFDSLSEEQRKAQVDTFTSLTSEVDAIAQGILGTAISDLKLSQDDINQRMVDSVIGAAGLLQQASDDMGAHVNTFGDWVQMLVTRGINIVVPSGSGAEVSV